MLEQLKKIAANHMQAANNSFSFLVQRPLSSFLTIIVITLTLILPSFCWVLAEQFNQLTAGWKPNGVISLYLKSDLTSSQQQAFLNILRQRQDIAEVALKSPEESMQELQKQEGMNDIMRYLPENPLPPLIEVVPVKTIGDPTQIEQLLKELRGSSEVDQAKLDMEWVRRAHAILNFIKTIAHGLILLLSGAVILIVGNTLRLAIHSRQDEIRVLKLVGASDQFIMRPFLYVGIWYGLIGALLAVILVNIFMVKIGASFQKIVQLYQMNYSLGMLTFYQSYVIVFIAILLAWLGANLSVRRQLVFIEPYN